MTLIVEDGSNVANANSYISLSYARTYAANRGVTLSADNAVLEPMMIRAMDWLEAKRASYQGSKTYEDQSLQWPRTDVEIDCADFPEDEIPNELKFAQAELAMIVASGKELFPSPSGANAIAGPIIRDVVGPIQTHYSDRMAVTSNVNSDGTYKIPTVESLMQALFNACGQSPFLQVLRA